MKRDVAAGVVRVGLYVIVAALPLGLAAVLRQGTIVPPAYELGRNFALIGIMVISLQSVLAARLKWAERAFGFDMVIRFHRLMGIFALSLMVSHPFLLAAGGWGTPLLIGVRVPWMVWAGRATLLLLVTHVLVSWFQPVARLRFERWRLYHDLLGPSLIVLAFVHSFFIGGDIRIPLLRGLWIALLASEVVVLVYHFAVRPALLARYRVAAVRPEAGGQVWTVDLRPPAGRNRFDFAPGQFHFLTFRRGRGLPEEEHHWTISASPTEPGRLASTIKALGDFTATMGETRPGDEAAVQGPFGRFSYLYHPDETDLVFVAGGIGITPVRSMLRHMADTKSDHDVLLLYANKTAGEIVFRDELDRIAGGGHPRLTVVHVLEKAPEDWPGERGFIDPEKLDRLCGPDPRAKAYYLVGPRPMTASVLKWLRARGIPDRLIHMEIFAFLD